MERRCIRSCGQGLFLVLWGIGFVVAVESSAQEVPPLSQPSETSASPIPAEQLNRWAVELDADDFFVRQRATERLIAAGKEAIASLQPVLAGTSLEANSRAIHILQELALSTDLETEEAARLALKATAEARFGAVARRASAALATLTDLRRDRALGDLEKLGVVLQKETVHNGFTVDEVITGLEIGPNFTGSPKELRLLAWIDIQPFQVTLSGTNIGDEHLQYLPDIKNLSSVVLKRASVTDKGLEILPRINVLNEINVLNTPITDNCLPTLKACKGLSMVKLYGTKMTRPAAMQLQTALGIAKVDYRLGAFLGVGGQQTLQGCQVGIVQEGSAADRAGIQVGDIIAEIGGKKVADFESLTDIISGYSVGDSVEIELLRDTDTLRKKITFGEWK